MTIAFIRITAIGLTVLSMTLTANATRVEWPTPIFIAEQTVSDLELCGEIIRASRLRRAVYKAIARAPYDLDDIDTLDASFNEAVEALEAVEGRGGDHPNCKYSANEPTAERIQHLRALKWK